MDEGFSATILKQKNDLNKWIAVNQNIKNLYIKKKGQSGWKDFIILFQDGR